MAALAHVWVWVVLASSSVLYLFLELLLVDVARFVLRWDCPARHVQQLRQNTSEH